MPPTNMVETWLIPLAIGKGPWRHTGVLPPEPPQTMVMTVHPGLTEILEDLPLGKQAEGPGL